MLLYFIRDFKLTLALIMTLLMIRNISGLAALLGLLTVVIGAFGAHSLKEKLDPEALLSFETGVKYMMYHVLALLLLTNNSGLTKKSKIIISYLFLMGILFFSGSIFIIALDIISAKQIWFITPLGGLLFILGWLYAAVSFFKSIDKN
jgi:uncharacterized membrane protein YgdD (TMEM256/DUF423 family)